MKINSTNVIGYLLVCAFVYFSVTKLTTNPSLFINMEAFVIIGLGLPIALLASFPWVTIKQTFHAIVKIAKDPPQIGIEEAYAIVDLSKDSQKDLSAIEKQVDNIEHPFLKEAVQLMLEGLKPHEIEVLLEKRIAERRDTLARDANVLLTLSKYAPALGLAATVLGLVELLSKIGNSGIGELGHGMAVALSATFYGIVFANLVFAPLSELVLSSGETDNRIRQMILDGVMQISQKAHPLMVAETVNSHLPIRSRQDFAEYLGGNQDRNAA